MRNLKLFVIAAASLIVLIACSPSAPAAPDSAADEAALLAGWKPTTRAMSIESSLSMRKTQS